MSKKYKTSSQERCPFCDNAHTVLYSCNTNGDTCTYIRICYSCDVNYSLETIVESNEYIINFIGKIVR